MNAEKCDEYLLFTETKGLLCFPEYFVFSAGQIYEGVPEGSGVTLRHSRRNNRIQVPIAVHKHVSEVAKLEDIEADLLLAVESFDERLSIYQERRDHLEMGKRLEVGSKVLVQVGSDGEIDRPGEIKYKGLMAERKGIWFGVELQICATIDGDRSYHNHKYFNCQTGTFLVAISLDKIKQRAGQLKDEQQKQHADTRGQLESEQQQHADTRRQLESEQQQHADTRRQLENKQEECRYTEEQLVTSLTALQEAESSLREHADTRRQLESEQQQHADTLSEKHDLERRLEEAQHRMTELESTLSTAQQALQTHHNSPEATDWVLERQEIELTDKIIGIGGWGKVVEGKFRGMIVAVKQIHQLILSPHNRRLFEREMNIAARCRHPCLLQFIGATNDDNSPLFVTELLDTSLRKVLQDRQLKPNEVTTMSLDVARALNYLHLNHPTPIIHRDISSANVLLWKQGDSWRAKVSDYGTANFMHYSMTISPGAVVYSAPEAQTSRQSPKVDVYSFGVLLCEMNTREFPDAMCRTEQVTMVTNHDFRDLIWRCLLEDPQERPSMNDIINELETFNFEK